MEELTKQQTQARAINYVLLQASEIDDNPIYNCRGKITVLDVQFLAEDIAKAGLLQPIVVREIVKDNFKYRVVAGFSRFMALRTLRWKEIPCVIRNCTDEEAAFINLSENLIRKDLNFMQEAEAIRQITLKYPRFNDAQVAERLGQNRGWVQVRLFALQMPEEVKDVIARGYVTYDQIKTIYKMKTEKEQLVAIRKIKEARERGQKVKLIFGKPKEYIGKQPRTREEMFAMQDHIVKSLRTHSFGTRCLAWAASEIDDFELFGDIENIAQNEDIPYEKPKTLDTRGYVEKLRDGVANVESSNNP